MGWGERFKARPKVTLTYHEDGRLYIDNPLDGGDPIPVHEQAPTVIPEAALPAGMHFKPLGPRAPRMFALRRDEDITGVSGIGDVAYGIEFPDGVVALRWIGAWPTSVVFHDEGIASVEHVHGHGGRTRIVWLT